MPDLFSIVLPSVLGAAASWATKRTLDAVVGCPACGREHERRIDNLSANTLTCGCQNALLQYSAATPSTIINGRLMGANIFFPHWETSQKGLFFKRPSVNWFLLDVNTVGMQNRGMVITGSMRDYRSGKRWPCSDIVLNNPYERTQYARLGWYFELTAFPAYSQIIAEIEVKTLDGDVLHSVAPVFPFSPM